MHEWTNSRHITLGRRKTNTLCVYGQASNRNFCYRNFASFREWAHPRPSFFGIFSWWVTYHLLPVRSPGKGMTLSSLVIQEVSVLLCMRLLVELFVKLVIGNQGSEAFFCDHKSFCSSKIQEALGLWYCLEVSTVPLVMFQRGLLTSHWGELRDVVPMNQRWILHCKACGAKCFLVRIKQNQICPAHACLPDLHQTPYKWMHICVRQHHPLSWFN